MYKVLGYCEKAAVYEQCFNCEKAGDVLQVELGWDQGVTPICRTCLLESLELAAFTVRECV